ncbi:MAG TPA: DEDD exonuclease domain-containing protein [Acidimicrobiales bacterium]
MQRSFDELGTPLAEVTFAVVDLETTGGSPNEDAITEIGAVKVRGGECLGTFHTLVNPGSAIPPAITVLTGITAAMVAPAPRVHAVLPALAEFLGGTVVVGHNIRFDLGFLNAAFGRDGWPRLANPSVDTAALARRLVRDEVPNCRLGTLADRFRLDHKPSHRALDDALATTDLLHLLLERAAAWGVLGLDDLLVLPRLGGHPQAAKLRLTTALPRSPGVYWFVDARGVPLYVGKAANLRQRVRSYFSGDDRRKIGNLLRETVGVRHHVVTSTLEAAVVEARLIHRLQPRYNRQGTRWRVAPFVALTLGERFPRLKVVRVPRADGSLYLGPLPSTQHATSVVEAIQTVAPLRRCAEALGPRTTLPRRADPCLPAQLGVALCPCAGAGDAGEYRQVVQMVVEGLTTRPDALLDPLRWRLAELADARRFEEAALVRDRAGALAGALRRQRRVTTLRSSGRVRLVLPGGAVAELEGGILVHATPPPSGRADQLPFDTTPPALAPAENRNPLSPELALELATVVAWLDREAHRVRLERCDGTLASAWPALPSFTPGEALARRKPLAA